jgi:peptide/nickel transport system permease protein
VFGFILRRLLLMVPTTLGIALVVFAMYHAAPGNAATVMLGFGSGEMSGDSDVQARLEKFERRYGLDRSLAVQFFNYIGPFNLLRDGHTWFSSPYSERKVHRVRLADGERAEEDEELEADAFVWVGEALRLEHLPGTLEAERGLIEADVAALLEGSQEPGELRALTQRLVEHDERALPALFSALFEVHLDLPSRDDAVDRISALLVAVTKRKAAPAPELALLHGRGALIGDWFAWYYRGIGRRVVNTGESPWGGLLALDLGEEMQRKTSVAEELLRRLKVTVPLSLISLLLSYAIAIPLGIYSVRRQGTLIDALLSIGIFVLFSIPTFWAGLMLIRIFGVTGPDWWWWPRLPVLGLFNKDHSAMGEWEQVWDVLLHCIMPVATLTYGGFTYLSRQMRGGMLEVVRQDYIRTARAKGLSERVVIYKHALRNSVIPVITLFASILPIMVGGSIIVESVFDIPGMGRYAFEGLLRRDFYIVMSTTIFVGIMTQIGLLLSDVSYALVDPRIRYD